MNGLSTVVVVEMETILKKNNFANPLANQKVNLFFITYIFFVAYYFDGNAQNY